MSSSSSVAGQSSFLPYEDRVKVGDVVVLYGGFTSIDFLKVEADGLFHHRLGQFKHTDLIGKEYGKQVTPTHPNKLTLKRTRSYNSRQVGGFLTVLPVTPELWCKSVSTRTAITTPLDNSLIVAHLHLAPGKIVVESGTGTGCLSLAFARTVAPTGQLHTYEYNKDRAEAAAADFKRLKLEHLITTHHRDVYKDGFCQSLANKVDAVFLDLPCPWLAVDHALKVLKSSGRICTFSPCIGQVQRTSELLSIRGFSRVLTIECLSREFRVVNVKRILPQTLREFSDDTFRSQVDASTPEMAEMPQAKRSRPDDSNVAGEKNLHGDVKTEEKSNGEPKTGEGGAVKVESNRYDTVLHPTAVPFDRMKGHNGFLTFAYAPHKKT